MDGVISAIAAGDAPYKLGPCAGKQAGYQASRAGGAAYPLLNRLEPR